MPDINQNILKKLKRKYPGLPVVGSPKDWERIEKMLSKDDLKLYKLITKRGKWWVRKKNIYLVIRLQ